MYLNDKSFGCGCGGGASVRTSTRPASTGGCGCSGHECDGLTCSCRPRFFDGQLITAADFRRLDRYLVDKDRLHNRYLHGVGVVCGLEVVCNPCDDTVTVRVGYALGPCGEDIVVCADTRVDVAALVRDHRRGLVRDDCPPYGERPTDCEAAMQQWVLGICYDEHAAGGVASLKQPGGSCGCGGSCGGGCGGSTGVGRSAPACEPTQICEGYRFTLTKIDPGNRVTDDKQNTEPQFGPDELPSRVRTCLTRLQAMVTKVPKDPGPAELANYCCQLKADLRDLMETSSVHDCRLERQLNAVVCPAAEDAAAAQVAQASIAQLLQIAIALFRMCVSSALLPPCGVGVQDDCVPLAVLTVRTADLQVLDICNWSARKFAVTMPALGYWLGWIPIFDTLRASIERVCCGQPTRRFQVNDKLRVSAVKAQAAAQKSVANPAAAAGGGASTGGPADVRAAAVPAFLIAQYAGQHTAMTGLEATVLGAMGAQDPDGGDLASRIELQNPLAALAVGRFGFESFEELVPDAVRQGARTGRGDSDRVAKLESELAELQRKVKAQDGLIRKLEKGPDQ